MAGLVTREQIRTARRLVVKIGSSSLTRPDYTVDPARLDALVDAIAQRIKAGSEVIVVSSGAIASGIGPMGLHSRPSDLATRQAAAAVGQVHLAQEWGRSFARYGFTTAQLLLTASDAGDRARVRNIQRTIERLCQLGVVPIVNENDTVATSEMHFGDNDRLAAVVSFLIGADGLVLLSDVDGLYTDNPSNPDARFIAQVSGPEDLEGVIAGEGGAVGTGGMATKVAAATMATRSGIPVLLTSAALISQALGAAEVGTAFAAGERKLSAWKAWALDVADVSGGVRVDEGAMKALLSGGHSLLAVGVTEVIGEFHTGDIIEVLGPVGQLIARGEAGCDWDEAKERMGQAHVRPIIHADYLSLS
ncbi:MAG: glutamate 5-kinase [Corynebacterium sp.]|nr:glutamate 5-kinase [Corynebacterium sp.]